MKIKNIKSREILDSRGTPTVAVEVILECGCRAEASVPSGASTGQFEAVELRDKEIRYHGLGVQMAVDHVNTKIAPEVIGMNVFEQVAIDAVMLRLDGTQNKSNLGANAMLGVSMAVARAGANALNMPLYRYLGGVGQKKMPALHLYFPFGDLADSLSLQIASHPRSVRIQPLLGAPGETLSRKINWLTRI